MLINQAYRYNNYLGEVFIGVRAKAGGGYEVGDPRRAVSLGDVSTTVEDAAIKAIVDPYVDRAERIQQQSHRPDHSADRRTPGLHSGDQRGQPAGGRLGV